MLLNGLSFVAFFPLLLSATLFLLFVTHALFFYCLTWAEQNEGHELWPKFGVSAGRVGGGGGGEGGVLGSGGFQFGVKGLSTIGFGGGVRSVPRRSSSRLRFVDGVIGRLL